MHWIVVAAAAIGVGIGLVDMRIGAVYAGLNFCAVVAAGFSAAMRSGSAWLVLAGGKPGERLTPMERRLVGAGLAGIGGVLVVLLAGPHVQG